MYCSVNIVNIKGKIAINKNFFISNNFFLKIIRVNKILIYK